MDGGFRRLCRRLLGRQLTNLIISLLSAFDRVNIIGTL